MRPDCPNDGPALRGGIGRTETRRDTPNLCPKTQKYVLGHDRTARLLIPASALRAGGRQEKTRRNTPNPSPNSQKRVLGHGRTARLPRPALALRVGGVGMTKHPGTPQTSPRDSENAKTNQISKNQTLEPRKTKTYRAQRRSENQLFTVARGDSSTLRWTPRVNALDKGTCRHQEPRTAPVEVV